MSGSRKSRARDGGARVGWEVETRAQWRREIVLASVDYARRGGLSRFVAGSLVS